MSVILCPFWVCIILWIGYNTNIIETQENTMTLEQFNNQIISIANKIFAIREYSYNRRGAKFDYRRPNLMLSDEEKQRVEALEKKALEILETYTAQ
jgi:hypothetical protein